MGALLPARGSGALIATILAYAAMTAVVFHNLLPSMTTAIYSSIGDPLLNTSVARLFESRMWTANASDGERAACARPAAVACARKPAFVI